MAKQIKLSTRGRVTVPKDVRDRLGYTPGMMIEFVQEGDVLRLRKASEYEQLCK